jgi:uncharacterized protein
MIYRHCVYGKVNITEPVILDLIKLKEIQRLKHIEQGGYTPLYNNIRNLPIRFIAHKRFEHSMGVFILLKKFNAPLEEQIAGLIHDISHGVFSHSVDYLFGRGNTQDHSDRIFNKFFGQSNIPKILQKYNFKPSRFLNKKNFPILEKDLPDLCADRIDYILMLALIFKEGTKIEVNNFLNNLLIINKHWVFKNYLIAKKFAKMFRKINRIQLSDVKSAAMHHTIANLLKYAIEQKYINKKDIFTTDNQVIGKIKKHLGKDKILKELFIRFSGKMEYKNDPQDYDYLAFCKSRVVDPLCIYQGKRKGVDPVFCHRSGKMQKSGFAFCSSLDKIKRISEIDKKWKTIIKNELKPKKYYLKLL